MYTQNDIHKISTASPLVYNKMGWLGDGSHRGQGHQAWTAVGLPPRYPLYFTEGQAKRNQFSWSLKYIYICLPQTSKLKD